MATNFLMELFHRMCRPGISILVGILLLVFRIVCFAGEKEVDASGNLSGEWEPFSKAFIGTGNVKINKGGLAHERCKSKFQLKSHSDGELFFGIDRANTCFVLAPTHPANAIAVRADGEDVILSYFTSFEERELIGVGAYSRYSGVGM